MLMDHLNVHLMKIESEKEEVISRLFANEAQEREAFEAYIDTYIKDVMALKQGLAEEVRAFIGSIVELEDIDEGDRFDVHIASPLQEEHHRAMSATYLSPMGKAILLKKQGDEVTVKTPNGDYRYRIMDIKTPTH